MYIPDVKNGILEGRETFAAKVVDDSGVHDITLNCAGLNEEEREILTRGCLINYYAASLEKNK